MFGDRDRGGTLKAAAALAIAALAISMALGVAAERFAERGFALADAALPPPVERRSSNAIDFATTGSIPGESGRALVILSPCGEH